MRLPLLVLAAFALPTIAPAQTPPVAKPAPPAKPEKKPREQKKPKEVKQTRPLLTLTTDKGPLQIELFPDDAPRNVANLLALAQSGFYDGLTFHRVEDWVAQGGDPKGDGTGGPGYLVDNEPNRALKNVRGAIGMANSGRDTAGSQFYLLKKDAPSLDGGAYTLVGMVTSGMETLDKLAVGDKITRVSVVLPAGYKAKPFGPTRRAEPDNLVWADLPEDAGQREYRGTVRVKASVSVRGVAVIHLMRGSGDEEIDQAALAALGRWKWSPALKEGQPVESDQEFEYDLAANTRRYDP